MSSIPPGFLLFPSEVDIVSYLKHHPSTNSLDVRKSKTITQKIVEVVANFFANKGVHAESIEMHLVDLLSPLNTKLLRVSEAEMSTVQSNLTYALKDCARGKKIESEKKKIET